MTLPTELTELTYGVELECYLPQGATMAQASAAVTARLGAHVSAEGYNHQRRPHWKVVTDGSLGDIHRGIEFVSPVLRGDDGIEQIRKVTEALQDFGCTVSKACGTHVHVGASGQPLDFFKRMARLYQTFEPVIDTLMPPSRRASNNSYCKTLTSISPARIEAATTPHTLFGQGGPMADRFLKLNLAAFNRHTTVEFRQHSGTLDASKIEQWVTTCLRMVKAAQNPNLTLGSAPRPATAANRARRGSKAFQIGELMLRPEGVTAREVCALMNWPSVSMPAQAQACGLTYTTQRTGREIRYFARMAEAEVAQPAFEITLDGFANLIGSTTDERAYMARRVANLSGPVLWAA